MNKLPHKLAIIIPVYNGERSIFRLVTELFEVFKSYPIQIVCVDDHSKDLSWEELKKLKGQFPNQLTIIQLSQNFGQHQATICGLQCADADYYLTLDDDYSHLPSEALRLVEMYQGKSFDVVYGIQPNKTYSLFRKLLVRTYRKLAGLLEKSGKGSSFRLLSHDLVNKITAHHTSFVFLDEFIRWHAATLLFEPSTPGKSNKLQSGYSLLKLFSLTGNLIMISSTWPLRMVTLVGALLALFNFAIGTLFLVKKFFYNIHVDGYTSLIVSILFSSGVIVFTLGILAQYIRKIVLNQYQKPGFVIKEMR